MTCHLLWRAAAQQLCDDTACESCMETTVRDIPHCTAGEYISKAVLLVRVASRRRVFACNLQHSELQNASFTMSTSCSRAFLKFEQQC